MTRLQRFLAALCALLSAVGISGCDAGIETLRPGQSSEGQVRAILGAPSAEWQQPDGNRLLEFTRQPNGDNYLLLIGSDGILREFRRTINEATFNRVERGMSRDSVRQLLGKPAENATFPAMREEVWSWNYKEQGFTDTRQFHVHFAADGDVVRVSRTQQSAP